MTTKAEIPGNWETLNEDAVDFSAKYFRSAIKVINEKLGDGYAEKHPELIGMFMNIASNEMRTAVFAKCLLELRDSFDEYIYKND